VIDQTQTREHDYGASDKNFNKRTFGDKQGYQRKDNNGDGGKRKGGNRDGFEKRTYNKIEDDVTE